MPPPKEPVTIIVGAVNIMFYIIFGHIFNLIIGVPVMIIGLTSLFIYYKR